MRLFGNYYVITFTVTLIFFGLSQGALLYIQDLLIAVGGNADEVGKINGFKTFMDAGTLLLFPLLRKKFSLRTLVCAGGFFYCIEMLLYPICADSTQVMLVALCNGTGIGLLLGGGINYMSALAPEGLESTAISLYTLAGYASQVLSGLFARTFLDKIGIRNFYSVLGTTVGLALLLFIFSFWFGKHVLKIEAPVSLRSALCN
jgi:MFS-type transporter involved in bile tolerance (Atg22 family)